MLAAAQSQLPPCAEAYPKGEAAMLECERARYSTAQTVLEGSWRRALANNKGDDAQTVLTTAQNAWVKFRDAHCEAVAFPSRGSSLADQVKLACLADLTEARSNQLAEFGGD
ncbi:lysozyme inhibitor LprI family protein [Sphingomonas oryzagri]